MRGGIVGDEEFLVWEPNRRMAFRVSLSAPLTNPMYKRFLTNLRRYTDKRFTTTA